VNAFLPLFVEEGAEPRSGHQVATRMFCLTIIAARGEGLEKDIAERVLKERSVYSHLTANERVFLDQPVPSHSDRVQFTWKYECAWVLQWALGLVNDLGEPSSQCDAAMIARMAQDTNLTKIGPVRSFNDLADIGDLYYRMHWACRDAQLRREPAPVNLVSGVVWERRRAFQWLLEPDVDWDDLSLDT